MDYQALGMRIRLQRKNRQLTQLELAEKANVSFSFLGHIERGTRKASLETLVDLCNALSVSPAVLLQDSLEAGAIGETSVSRRDLVREISDMVLEKLGE